MLRLAASATSLASCSSALRSGAGLVSVATRAPHVAAFNAALTPVALPTASTIGVAPVKNFPAIHVGCVGWNVLKDPVLWVR